MLLTLAGDRNAGPIRGIPSVCSAHPLVIAAAFSDGCTSGVPVLIEATCNQVNHDGGYTGMTPGDFRRFVLDIAAAEGLDAAGLILGDDNPGPDPWQDLPAVAKRHSTEQPPVYAIGTEVPVPGSALETVEHLVVTTPAHPGLARFTHHPDWWSAMAEHHGPAGFRIPSAQPCCQLWAAT